MKSHSSKSSCTFHFSFNPNFALAKTVFISVRQLIVLTLLFAVFENYAFAQRKIDWGYYINDPGLINNLDNDEFIEQIAVDRSADGVISIYAVGLTYSPDKISTNCPCGAANCLGNGDAFLAKYQTNTSGLSPVKKWIKYFGGTGLSSTGNDSDDWGYSIALDHDALNNTFIYIGGAILRTETDFDACDNGFVCNNAPYQQNNSDNWDGFIALYKDNGNTASLQKWTYLGGTGASDTKDEVLGLAVFTDQNSARHVFAVGYTESQLSLGGVNTYAGTLSGVGDGFIAEFDQCLSTLQFFTYYNVCTTSGDACSTTSCSGPTGQDRTRGIKIDASGNLYVSGTAESQRGIALGSSVYQSCQLINGGQDAFVGKWVPNNLTSYNSFTPQWSTYITGSNAEHGRQLDLITEGGQTNVVTTLLTNSTSFPSGLASYTSLPKTAGNGNDGLVVKLDGSNGSCIWRTFIGGTSWDYLNGVRAFTVNGTTKIAVDGLTTSTDLFTKIGFSGFPILSCLNGNGNAVNNNRSGDAFVAILSDNGSTTVSVDFASYLGGSCGEFWGPDNCLQAKPFTGYGPFISYLPSNTTSEDEYSLYTSFSTASADVHDLLLISGISGQHVGQLITGSGCYGQSFDAYVAKIVKDPNATTHPCLNTTACSNSPRLQDEDRSSLSIINSITPNPSDGISILTLNSDKEMNGRLNVYDMFGQVIISRDIQLSLGQNEQPIDLKPYPAGMYFLRFSSAEEAAELRIIKQ